VPRFVAFLRAVNVGDRVVKMDALKNAFVSAGATDVESFIASGNMIFSSKVSKRLEAKLAKTLAASLSFEVPVFVRSLEALHALAAHRPFPEKAVAAAPTYLVGFLSKVLDAEGVGRLSALETPDDRFHVEGRDFWWLSKNRQSDPAITGRALEKALGQPTTLRNVNTIRRMAERYSP
jgi:uncharacterized protein (DUF1697 family)